MKLAYAVPLVDDCPGKLLMYHLRAVADASRLVDEVKMVVPIGVFPWDRARNIAVSNALTLGCDWLWFVDADTAVPPGAFELLMESMDKAPVISGHYVRRGWPYTSVWSKRVDGLKGETVYFQTTATEGVHEINTTGMGCALINLRWCKENLEFPWFYYKSALGDDQAVMEDLFFCDKVLDAGGKILGDARVRCRHLMAPEFVDDDNMLELRKKNIKDRNEKYTAELLSEQGCNDE